MNTRKAKLLLIYNNVDISQELSEYMTGWTYTDNMSGAADDLQISLENRDLLWISDWVPEKGATLSAGIIRENWNEEGKNDSLRLGTFDIDEIEASAPPSTAVFKSVSIPESSSLRGENKNRAWEKTKLSVIANDISKQAGLGFFYDTDYDPEYDRIDQTEESDLSFLMSLCKNAGLCLKVTDKQIVIFDEQKYEAKEPIGDIVRDTSKIKYYQGRTTMNDVYSSCLVKYHDPNKNEVIQYKFTPKNPPKTNRVLVINERVSSIRDAEILAKKRLRQKNKKTTIFTVTIPGDLRYLASLTVNISGFGYFDGKYVITTCTHSQRNGFETKLKLRKCLEGY